MNVPAFGGDSTWKEKLHFNGKKFNSKEYPEGQKQEFLNLQISLHYNLTKFLTSKISSGKIWNSFEATYLPL